MERRDKGNGSVFQRKDGRWVCKLASDGVTRTVYAKSEKEAKAKLKELLTQAQQGILRAPSHQTLSEYLSWWLETSKPRLKPTTAEWYGIILSTHVMPTLGKTKLDKLSPIQLTTLYSKKLQTLSPASVRHIHNCLRKALNDAVKLDLIGANVALKVDPPRVEQTEPEMWDEQELRRFVASELTNPTRWSCLWLTLLATGLRIGEALGLTWANVDFDDARLEVKQTIAFVDNQPTISTPKSKTSRRVIALPSLALQALRKQQVLQAQDRLRLGSEWQKEGFVFLTDTGNHPGRNNLNKRLKEACARAHVTPVHPHLLRHINASLLAQGGADVRSLQKRMGHSSLQTTLGTYVHLLSDSERNLAETLDQALSIGSA